MKFECIVCVDENWGIGYEKKLLFHIPKDMKFFKKKTKKSIVVMGRKTFESLPDKKPLKKRINVVLTRVITFKAEGFVKVGSKKELFNMLKKKEYNDKKVFIIGGESIYKCFLDDIDKVYVTKVFKKSENVDTYFPNLDKNDNFIINYQDKAKRKYKDLEYMFVEYIRK